MSYSQDKFNSRDFNLKATAASFGTATNATVNTTSVTSKIPAYVRRTQISGGKLFVTTIPNAAATALTAHLMNGTNTIGTCVLTTATASQVLSFTITTASNGYVAAGSAPTIKVTGTATASGDALGAYDIWLEEGERFSA